MRVYKLKQISMVAGLAGVLVLSGCHKKVPPPAPAPPPPPAPVAAPTATITASPSVIEQGQSATLTWSTNNATSATITGIGTVGLTGSQTVSPNDSTSYTIMVKGPGGTVEASARLTVNRPPPPPPPPPPSMTEEQLFEQNIKDAFFNYDKFVLRPDAVTAAQTDASFLAQHPNMKIVVEGYCDDRGSAEYNLALGESRAESMKKALVSNGVPASSIKVVSFGKEKQFCSEETEECWQKNRRAHLRLDH